MSLSPQRWRTSVEGHCAEVYIFMTGDLSLFPGHPQIGANHQLCHETIPPSVFVGPKQALVTSLRYPIFSCQKLRFSLTLERYFCNCSIRSGASRFKGIVLMKPSITQKSVSTNLLRGIYHLDRRCDHLDMNRTLILTGLTPVFPQCRRQRWMMGLKRPTRTSKHSIQLHLRLIQR